jgi:hypothetical protein
MIALALPDQLGVAGSDLGADGQLGRLVGREHLIERPVRGELPREAKRLGRWGAMPGLDRDNSASTDGMSDADHNSAYRAVFENVDTEDPPSERTCPAGKHSEH